MNIFLSFLCFRNKTQNSREDILFYSLRSTNKKRKDKIRTKDYHSALEKETNHKRTQVILEDVCLMLKSKM